MKEIPIPVLYERKEDCCGCSACYAICPKSAIKMVEDEEGFEYPLILLFRTLNDASFFTLNSAVSV